MKKIILITDSPIIKQIFALLAVKMQYRLSVTTDFDSDLSSDVLIVDEAFINDKFNFLKRQTKKLGAISSVELGFGKAKDFIVKKPFLPSELEIALKQVFNELDSKFTYTPSSVSYENSKPFNTPKSNIDTSITEPLSNYLESLADDIAQEINDKNDDSVVSAKLVNGSTGILDKIELGKIKDILDSSEKQVSDAISNIIDDELNDVNDWCELSEIIDKTINELEQKANKNKTLKILLNDLNIEELKPLLLRLDKNTIEELSNGSNVEIHLKLGAKK